MRRLPRFRSPDVPEFFGFVVPDEVVAGWQAGGAKHVIAQAELLPVLVARRTWAARLQQGARVVHYVDNEGVRKALIKGGSKSIPSRRLLIECASELALSGSHVWYGRVPSPSIPADEPSRSGGGPPGFPSALAVRAAFTG